MKFKELFRNPHIYFPFFFAGCSLYFVLVFYPALYYHLHQPMFLFSCYFLNEFLLHPGGIVEWLGQFIEQFFYADLAGALILGLFFTGVYLIVFRIMKKLADVKLAIILAFLPVSLLLALQNNYTVPFLLTLKYLVSLLFFMSWLKMPPRFRMICGIPLFVLFYWVLGGVFYLFLMLLIVLSELFYLKNFSMAGITVTAAVVLPYIAARFFFMITFTEAYLYAVPYENYYQPFMFKPSLIYYLFIFSLPLLMIMLFLHTRYLKEKIHWKQGWPDKLMHSLVQWTVVLLATGLIFGFTFQPAQRNNIQIDYYADQRQWSKVLQLSVQSYEFDRQVIFNINRALFFSGQLLEHLFNYNQFLGTDNLFINKIMASQIALPASDLYFDLGHVNAAQALAYEGQTKFKYNPGILKRLALTNLINGNNAAAEKFLILLNQSLLHRSWAAHYQKYLTDKSLLLSDPLIQVKRALQPQFDFFINQKEPQWDLIKLLNANEKNRMAYEYLMAYFLLDTDLGNLVKYLQKFKAVASGKMPRHIQEALILYKALAPPDPAVKLDDFLVNRQTIEQFTRFSKILYENKSDEKQAQQLLKKEFAYTYWYYFRYLNPRKTNIKVDKRIIDESIY